MLHFVCYYHRQCDDQCIALHSILPERRPPLLNLLIQCVLLSPAVAQSHNEEVYLTQGLPGWTVSQRFSNFFDHGPLLRHSWRTPTLVTVKFTAKY